MIIPDNILFRYNYDKMISVLSNWEAHTSDTEGEARCERFKHNCPFMGKMPRLYKRRLDRASGGNNNKDDTDKDDTDKDDTDKDDTNKDDTDSIVKKYCCFFQFSQKCD